MKRSWLYGLMVIWLLVWPARVRASEAITKFNSQIDINKDTSISITETIDYTTTEAHHGIIRYIPTQYRVNGEILKTPIVQINVTDGQGNNLTVAKTAENQNVVLKIGDPNTTFTGSKTYQISYRVQDAIKQFPDHDELYWDITGEGWKIPIKLTTATVNSNFAPITKTACYAGTYGTDNGLCISSNTKESAIFRYNQEINYNDNVTIAVALDKNNQLIFPSSTQKFLTKLMANWWIPIIFTPILIMALYWFIAGRDLVFDNPNVFDMDPNKPYHKKPLLNGNRVPFVYEPIQALTPGEAGAMIDEKVDSQDIVAEIIDLARKKYLKITRQEGKGFLAKDDYLFEKLKDWEDLPSQQQIIMEGIFGEDETKTLSQLKGHFYTDFAKARTSIEDSLTQRKLYVNNPRFSRSMGAVLAITVNVLGWMVIGKSLNFVGSPWWYITYLIQAAGSLILGINSVQKTAVGSNLAMQAAGLKRMINYGKWREEIKEKNLFIEEVLPFAVALGVVKKLSQDMQALGLNPPQYMSGTGVNNLTFHSLVSDFSAQAASNLSYNPNSSRASGGSGFSGGFSGGGGGGGGGGSW